MNKTFKLSATTVANALTISESFQSANPFRHACIDQFLEEDFARKLLSQFPKFDTKRAINEHGAVGGKSTQERVRELGDAYAELDEIISSFNFINFIEKITGIPGLIFDPLYIGGGTHDNRHGQELDPHIDFNLHPKTKYHRRLNLIIYLNENWLTDWGGSIEIHSNPRNLEENSVKSFTPIFNRCVIFETNEYSWHGFPKINLPTTERDTRSRKSFAIYYYTQDRPQNEKVASHGTFYVQRPLSPDAVKNMDPGTANETAIALKRRDNWILYYQRKELEWMQQIENLEISVRELSAKIHPAITGTIAFNGNCTGYFHDKWTSRNLSISLMALESTQSIIVSTYLPKSRKHIEQRDAIRAEINGIRCIAGFTDNEQITIVIPTDSPTQINNDFHLTIDFGYASTSIAINESHDTRELAYIINGIRGLNK